MRVRLALALALAARGALSQAPAPARPAPPAAVTPPAGPRIAGEPALGNYLSSRLNGKPLPVVDHASDDAGMQYLIEFDELILSIRPNHEFRAALRYRQTLAAKGERLSRDPIQKMIVFGTWAVEDGALRFTPDPNRGGSGLRILTGRASGSRLEVPFDYQNGRVSRRATVVLIRDANII